MTILPTSYLAPIQYYSKLKKHPNCIIEHFEHFPKQTYRSRCDIYSPNGLLTLSVPLVKRNQRQVIKDLKISYEYDWQKLHWRSLESSYRRSPFFEYYEDDFHPFYHDKKFDFLIDLNEALQQEIFKLLKLKINYSFTTEYKKEYTGVNDLREIISPKVPLSTDKEFSPTPYWQVFEPRHGFIPNLSIVDLLFNQGSKALEYI
ncbi:MAG: WbqC family protein [Bacteroidota bacterium]